MHDTHNEKAIQITLLQKTIVLETGLCSASLKRADFLLANAVSGVFSDSSFPLQSTRTCSETITDQIHYIVIRVGYFMVIYRFHLYKRETATGLTQDTCHRILSRYMQKKSCYRKDKISTFKNQEMFQWSNCEFEDLCLFLNRFCLEKRKEKQTPHLSLES